MKVIIAAGLLLASCLCFGAKSKYPKKMVVRVPVADLRAKPKGIPSGLTLPTTIKTDPLAVSQLLLGEHIIAHEEFIDSNLKKWLKISAIQQEIYGPESGWYGCPGWIYADQAIETHKYPVQHIVVKSLFAKLVDQNNQIIKTLSIGTRLHGHKNKTGKFWHVTLPDGSTANIHDRDVFSIPLKIQEPVQDLRKSMVLTARKFMDSWYCWGGRSAQSNEFELSGVDCSGLIGLVFLAHGLQVPKNSHSQFLMANKIKFGKDLQPGDLIFFCPIATIQEGKPLRMNHVMLYAGNGNVIEAASSGEGKVREISFKERIGKSHHEMQSGDASLTVTTRGVLGGQYYIYFGSYCSDPKKLQDLRDKMLKH